MSKPKFDINLDDPNLYEFIDESYKYKNLNENKIEHINTLKTDKIKKDNYINILFIIAIVFILLGIYCYFNKSTQSFATTNDNIVESYYLL